MGVEYCLFVHGLYQSLEADKRNAPHFFLFWTIRSKVHNFIKLMKKKQLSSTSKSRPVEKQTYNAPLAEVLYLTIENSLCETSIVELPEWHEELI